MLVPACTFSYTSKFATDPPSYLMYVRVEQSFDLMLVLHVVSDSARVYSVSCSSKLVELKHLLNTSGLREPA